MSLKTKTFFFFIVVLLVGAGNFITLLMTEKNAAIKERWIHHTYEVIHEADALLAAVTDAETGQRGYLVSLSSDYLEPYHSGKHHSFIHFEKLLELTADDTLQQERLKEIQKLLEQKIDELEYTIQLAQKGKMEEALFIVKTNLGKELMNKVRVLLNEFKLEENKLLTKRKFDFENEKKNIRHWYWGILAMMVAVFILASIIIQTKIINPLVTLTESAVKLGRGELIEIDNIDCDDNNEIIQLTNAFNQMSFDIQERTAKLEESLERISKTKTQLIESEKMASLGRLVAGVAHELNTPIGVCITATSFLRGEIQSMTKTYNNGNMLQKDFEGFLNDTSQSVDIIESNLNRAVTQVSHFKMVAVDVTSEMPRTFLLQEYISQLAKELHHELKHSNHQLIIECDPKLSVESYPGALTQILTNMIMNSLIHAYDKGETGQLLITAMCIHEIVRITYSDDGHGMTSETVNNVFEPFYTTKRNTGGSGLGMHILYNLVTQTLKGEVECVSELGQGTTFNISFPVKLS